MVRELLDPVPGAGSERLEEKAPYRVEELLSDLGRKFGELLLRPLVGDVARRHRSPSVAPKFLVYFFQLAGGEPTSFPSASLQLC